MATIREHRLVYQFNVDRAPKGLLADIKQSMLDVAPSIPNNILEQLNKKCGFKELVRDKIVFHQKNIDEVITKFEILWYPKGYQLNDLKTTNKNGSLENTIKQGIPLFGIVQSFKLYKKIDWLTVKEEELRCELHELSSIQKIFKQNGIDTSNPTKIVIKSSQAGKKYIFEDVAGIEKSSNKTGVADFILTDSKGCPIPDSGISHKCTGFERYAAYKTILKTLKSDSSLKMQILETEKKINNRWIGDSIKNEEASGYWSEINTENISELLYGNDAKILAVSGPKGLDLEKIGKNTFEFKANGKKAGGAEILLYPEIPESSDYRPIILVRYGSGGSKLNLPVKEVKRVLNKLSKNKTVSSRIQLKIKDKTKSSEVVSAYLPLRYYIAPWRRRQGKNINK